MREPSWAAADRRHSREHPGTKVWCRDAEPGEWSTLRPLTKLEFGNEWPGPPLWRVLKRAIKHFPEGAKLRIAVLRVRPGIFVRVPIVDYEGRDPDSLQRLGPGGSLVELSARAVIKRLRDIAKVEDLEL